MNAAGTQQAVDNAKPMILPIITKHDQGGGFDYVVDTEKSTLLSSSAICCIPMYP